MTDDSLSRVLILSDGCTNKGITDTEEITRYCTNATDHGITTSTYGLGEGFNEELMIQMANGGGGSATMVKQQMIWMSHFLQSLIH